jgi:hypothetical protein
VLCLQCLHFSANNLIKSASASSWFRPVSADQCRSVPVFAGQCRSVPVFAGQCRSVPVSVGLCRFFWVHLMPYLRAKLKSNGDIVSPCLITLEIGNVLDKYTYSSTPLKAQLVNYMYHLFDNQLLCNLPTQCICMFRTTLTINSDYFLK